MRDFATEPLNDDELALVIRKYDKDVDRKLNFREFIDSLNPLLQLSFKAKDVSMQEAPRHEGSITNEMA